MAFLLRKLVSQNKKRIVENGFDLDLTYLTDQIICMGLPAVGAESLYRNPIDSVVRFLEAHHASKYKVFNLCMERTYDVSKFGGACASFPFEDHGAPPLALIMAFCASATSWVGQGMDHVVAIHCKAGKGRTGLMACCLLLHLGVYQIATDAIACYNEKRTRDGKGLTVPSQRRYVGYYERLLGGAAWEGVNRTITRIRLVGPPPRLSLLPIVIVVREHGTARTEPPYVLPLEPMPDAPRGDPREARCALPVSSDVLVEVTDDLGNSLCRVWLHPALEALQASFVYHPNRQLSEVDVADKGAGLPVGFTIHIFMEASRPAAEPETRPMEPMPTPPPALPAPPLDAPE